MAPGWLHDGVTREAIEETVLAHSTESGTFAVRKQKGKISLCVVYKGKPTHHIISKDPEDGVFQVNKKKYGTPKSLNQVSRRHCNCAAKQSFFLLKKKIKKGGGVKENIYLGELQRKLYLRAYKMK